MNYTRIIIILFVITLTAGCTELLQDQTNTTQIPSNSIQLESYFPANLTLYNNKIFSGPNEGAAGTTYVIIASAKISNESFRISNEDFSAVENVPAIKAIRSGIHTGEAYYFNLKTGSIYVRSYTPAESKVVEYILTENDENTAIYIGKLENIKRYLEYVKNDGNPELQEAIDYIDGLIGKLSSNK